MGREPVKVWEHAPERLEEKDFHRTRAWPSLVDASKEVVEFKQYCSCKHCRHEWMETKAVEFDR